MVELELMRDVSCLRVEWGVVSFLVSEVAMGTLLSIYADRMGKSSHERSMVWSFKMILINWLACPARALPRMNLHG